MQRRTSFPLAKEHDSVAALIFILDLGVGDVVQLTSLQSLS